jgi:signal transduction histidine kinase
LNLIYTQSFREIGITVDFFANYYLGVVIADALICWSIAVLILWRKSNDWIGLLTALMLVLLGMQHIDLGPVLGLVKPYLGFVCVFLFFCLFPNGRFVPGFLRWVLPFFLVWDAILDLASFNLVLTLGGIGFVLIGLVAQFHRYRRVSTPLQRQQVKWVVFGTTLGLLLNYVTYLPVLFFPTLGKVVLLRWLDIFVYEHFFLCIPLSIGIALLRYRLWDIDIIVNRTLVYGVLTVSIVALYILVVVGLGTVFQAQGNLGIALLATGLVAVLFQPARNWLQRLVNRLMYGERDDPYRVISRLGQRLEATLAPEAVLPTIVETVAQALKLPYAAMHLQQGEEAFTAAIYGSARGDLVRLPLMYQHEAVGELVLAPRAPGEHFSRADRALLEDVARQAGAAAHAVQLTAGLKRLTVDLQHERERLVTAREEERRRLRRDLHDGLGPQLASLTLRLETARNRLGRNPLADRLLADLAQRTQATVAEIRRLVYALRPPALDELGLVSALRELTLQYSEQVAISLDAPDGLPELSAAVEVAIYRIAQEALTNAVRHAQALRCELTLVLDEESGVLTLSIQDDGCGLPPSRGVGVGLVSMRERAEELGGTWSIAPVESGGTRVLVRLPFTRSEKADVTLAAPHVVPQKEE